jgi:anti-sigma B factor antagonist
MESYTIEQNENQRLVILQGDLTAMLAPQLKEDLKNAIQNFSGELVFDLRQTEMLDSTGIGLLIAAGNSIGAQKGSMRIVNVSKEIIQLLQKMRLVARLNISGR